MPLDQVSDCAAELFRQIPHQATQGSSYLGFAADPYPYIRGDIDYVDSASAVLRLVANVARLHAAMGQPVSRLLLEVLRGTACRATDFLLKARIQDSTGVRWGGTLNDPVQQGRFANLFFTNTAASALKSTHASTDLRHGSDPRGWKCLRAR